MLLLFDFDGVIADSFDALLNVCVEAQACIGEGRPPLAEDFHTIENLTFEELGRVIGMAEASCAAFAAKVMEIQGRGWKTTAFPGMTEVLTELAGPHTLAVVSNSQSGTVRATLEGFGLAGLMKAVTGGESGTTKAERIQTLQKDWAAEGEATVMIGDTLGDIRAGKEAGVLTAAVTWGYQGRDLLLGEAPDFVLDKPDDLLRVRPFRYNTSGTWFKGNTHIHSIASDGGMNFSEIAELYASEGYDFLFRTDHWVASGVGADAESYPLLWLDGIELDGRDGTGACYHVVCLGRVKDLHRENGLEAAMESAREQGALTILAHPYWCGNSLADALRWDFDGVEVYNHVCHWLNGKSNGQIHWDATLMGKPSTLGLAADDSHLKPEHMGWNGGWICVNAEACSPAALLDAIRRGNFYSSCGPEIKSLQHKDGSLVAETSPVKFARLVGPGSRGQRRGGFETPLMESVTFSIPSGWDYAYLEIEDSDGRKAWTNALFC